MSTFLKKNINKIIMLFILFPAIAIGQHNVVLEKTIHLCKATKAPVDMFNLLGVELSNAVGSWHNSNNNIVSNVLFVNTLDLTVDEHSFYYLIEVTDVVCGVTKNDRFNLKIILDDVLPPTGAAEQNFCYNIGETHTISDLVVEGSNVKWYSANVGGYALDITHVLENDVTYYASQKSASNGCESYGRLAVKVKLHLNPNISIVNPGYQLNSYDLNNLVVNDANNTVGTITFHSAVPTSATDMTNKLASTIVSLSSKVYVMKATAQGCYDVDSLFVDLGAGLICHADTTVANLNTLCSAHVLGISPTILTPMGRVKYFSWKIEGATTGQSIENGYTPFIGYTFNVGVSTVTFKLTTIEDIEIVCQTVVTVLDKEPPVIVCPEDVVAYADANNCSIHVTVDKPLSVHDNCAIASVTNNFNNTNDASGEYPIGTTNVTWYAEDIHGNIDSCKMTVTVVDTISPTITCPENIVVFTDANKCSAMVTAPKPAVADNCGGIVSITNNFNNTNDASGEYPVGTTVVIWTATDVNGNTSTCEMTITVKDNQKPTIECPANITVNADANNCFATVIMAKPTVSDNCGGTVSLVNSFNNTDNASGTYPDGITEVVWTATDNSGNEATCKTIVTVVNSIPTPSGNTVQNFCYNAGETHTVSELVAIGSDIKWYLTPSGGVALDATHVLENGVTYYASQKLTATGCESAIRLAVKVNLDLNPDISIVDPGQQLAAFNLNNLVINDANNTVGTITFHSAVPISATDMTNKLASIIVSLSSKVYVMKATAQGCYDVDSITFDISAGLVCRPDTVVSNYVTMCSAHVDNLSPTILVPMGRVKYFSWKIDGATEAQSIENGFTAFTGHTFNVGVSTVTFKLTTIEGIEIICQTVVTVLDKEPPVIVCPEDVIAYADANNCSMHVTVDQPLSVHDNCAIASTTNNFNNTNDASGIYPIGTTNVTWYAKDIHGNIDSCKMKVTVVDTISPTITCPENIVVFTDANKCSAMVTAPKPIVTDNCGIASITNNFNNTNDASGEYPVGTTVVVWTATDVNGNTSTCEMTITVNDNQKPIIECPANITVNTDANKCSAAVTMAKPTVSDNCGGTVLITNNFNNTDNASGEYPVGTTVVVWTATDVNGNIDTCVNTVTVIDNQLPVVACGNDITVSTGLNSCTADVLLPQPTASDNCGIATMVNDFNNTDNASGEYPLGTTTVKWTITDVNNNVSTCEMKVTVVDNEAPTITCPENVIVSTDANKCSAMVTAPKPIVTDNCGIASITNNFNNTNDASGEYPVGTTVVIWTATDVNGKTSTCEMTITVNDNQKPIIECPANITVNADANKCSAAVTMVKPTVNDNCAVASITNNFNNTDNASGEYPVGTTVVVWTATDVNGNIDTCVNTVTVIDNQLPVLACANDTTVSTGLNSCTADILLPQPTASDNCGIATMVNDFNNTDNASGNYPVGTTTVKWTITDVNDNVSTCEMKVTVVDNEAPTITCGAGVQANVEPNQCFANVIVQGPNVSDNCSVASVTNSFNNTDNASGAYPVGVNEVIWTVTDASGNTSVCTQTVTIIDNILPEVICPPAITVFAADTSCSAFVNMLPVAATDNCAIDSIYNDFNNTNDGSGVYPVGTTLVNWTIKDVNGNTVYCTSEVTVVDNVNPTITCPEDITVSADSTTCSALVTVSAPVATDNCGVASVTNNFNNTNDASGNYPLGETIVNWTVTDLHGNTSECSMKVTVVDDIVPTITCVNEIVASASGNSCDAQVTIETPSVFDNCEVASVINDFNSTDNASGLYPVGTTVVNWTVTDIHGNIATCATNVVVVDDISPIILCSNDTTVNVDEGKCYATVQLPTPTISDNCEIKSITNSFNNTDNASGQYPVGTTEVVWTVIDSSNNVSTCAMSVTVIDNIFPVLACPGNISIIAPADSCTAFVNVPIPTYMDNCEIDTIYNSFNGLLNASGVYEVGVTQVVWTAIDVSGNTTSCTTTVSVIDDVKPTITCPANISAYVSDSCNIHLDVPKPEVSDNCGIASVVNNFNNTDNASGNYNVGVTTVIWTVTDKFGNVDSCKMTITVLDTIAPTIQCASVIEAYANPNTNCQAKVIVPKPEVSDNCGIKSIINNYTNTDDASGIYPIGDTIIKWTVEDNSGNIAHCLTLVKVLSKPIAVNDTANINLTKHDYVLISVLRNDLDCSNSLDSTTLVVVRQPNYGTVAKLDNSSTFKYVPNNDTRNSEDSFEYKICNKYSLCDTATVVVYIVKGDSSLVIYNLITPNGDGYNDKWHIDGIDNYTDNEIIIFNRWGDIVREFKGYNNSTIYWDGTNKDNKMLPDGTYYYMLKINKLNKSFKGWILLQSGHK